MVIASHQNHYMPSWCQETLLFKEACYRSFPHLDFDFLHWSFRGPSWGLPSCEYSTIQSKPLLAYDSSLEKMVLSSLSFVQLFSFVSWSFSFFELPIGYELGWIHLRCHYSWYYQCQNFYFQRPTDPILYPFYSLSFLSLLFTYDSYVQ